jgi:translocation and assembly module TamB
MNRELKGDSTWRLVGRELGAEGSVEVVRGTVEPLAGRVFHVERGRVTFPGGGVNAAQLDVVARYDNPVAVVTVVVAGPVSEPTIQFSSRPAMDDASIAMLIATGRTELNVNTSEVGPLTAEEAGDAVVSAAVNAAFTGLVADKLPVDQISVDTSRVRAGKYVTDKLFVGYAYRFDAKLEEGENANEVKAEYQLAPRWNFELRYGDAQAGDASLIWSKDY